MEFKIIEKPDWVSWEDIHVLLRKAHEQHIAHGMVMRTANLNGEELKERVGDGQCFVVIDSRNNLIATGAVKIKAVNTWYAKEKVGYLLLGAILPEYEGRGIFMPLHQTLVDYARAKNINVVTMDTAEDNKRMQEVLTKDGFRYVSCFSSKYSKHYSIVMAKWLDGCPFSERYCKWKFWLQKTKMKLRYKPGKVKRFGI